MDGKDLPHVLFPGLDRKLVNANVEELDGTITSSDEDLILVCFGPGEVEQRVLSIEPWLLISFHVG